MKAIELKQKPREELDDMLLERRKRLEELTFLSSQGKVKNVKEMSGVKKDIARILTLLREPARI
ncbi:MAG: 50S ribosomal protein L29 [Candidatus Sungbacteria bacterium RIFCSPLOWO2_01_FULL_47_10]|uniref:Large ribosomal subunit protein uL29 n=1 Tax=Candidatus Sungbacteria bacterium RIFCSPLOWO2_01_FULL_47_10 TaxID=1802276 RepID=A0A1G2L7Z4_9BACT|nr:MAG: 50S ribosomal protein L29 [Candidatus Sungbacteria bacterium RIFCSPLOWO2_01_FULL_47_10]